MFDDLDSLKGYPIEIIWSPNHQLWQCTVEKISSPFYHAQSRAASLSCAVQEVVDQMIAQGLPLRDNQKRKAAVELTE